MGCGRAAGLWLEPWWTASAKAKPINLPGPTFLLVDSENLYRADPAAGQGPAGAETGCGRAEAAFLTRP